MRPVTTFLTALATVIAACLPALASAKDMQVTTSSLKGPLHLMQGRGGNVVASVGDDGILLVDDDFGELAPAYQQAIDTLTGSSDTPRFVLNTHWHGDHTGGNLHWGETGAVLVAHANVRQRLAAPSVHPVSGADTPASPPAALPVVTFKDALALHVNGDDVELQHFPTGHTDGDSVVFFVGVNVVHMGDLFFNNAFPFVDTSSGGSLDGYIANVKQVLDRVDDSTVIVPGHGPVANKSDLARYLDMIQRTRAEVLEALAEGRSVSDVVEAGLSQRWKSWGKGFIKEAQWIATIAAAR